MSSKSTRSLITIVMNVFVILAVIVTATIVIRFFGALSSESWGQAIVRLGGYLTLPTGIEHIKTPYGGVFDVSAAITVAVMLLVEWVLSVIRARA